MLKKIDMFFTTFFMLSIISGLFDVINNEVVEGVFGKGNMSFLTTVLYFITYLLFIFGMYYIENLTHNEEELNTNINIFLSVAISIATISFIYFSTLNIFTFILINLLFIYFNSIIMYKYTKENNLNVSLGNVLLNAFLFSIFQFLDKNINEKK